MKSTGRRDYYFDNLKAVLILLVVFGHFLLPIRDDQVIVVIKRFIYIFHMPLFVFISGYFGRKIYKNGVFNMQKVFYLLKVYILFVILIQLVYHFFDFREFTEINFLKQSGAPWYLFAMIIWYLMIPLIKKMEAKVVLSVSIVLALAAGYVPWIGDFLCLSRILVFAPFFFLGYYMNREEVEKLRTTKYKNIVFFVTIVIGVFVAVFGSSLKDEMNMVYANVSYFKLEHYMTGAFVRGSLMILAVILSWALMICVPTKELWISEIGQRTMAIYIIHRVIRDVLKFSGLYKALEGQTVLTLISLVGISVLLTILLANKKVTEYMNKLLNLISFNKIKGAWKRRRHLYENCVSRRLW